MIKGPEELYWFASVITMPPEFWSLVSWASFFFKLASFAFAFPIVSLIVFDLALWIWRLIRPLPRSHSHASRRSSDPTRHRGHDTAAGVAAHHHQAIHSASVTAENAGRRMGYQAAMDS